MKIHNLDDIPKSPLAIEYLITLNVVQLQQLNNDEFESAFELYHSTIENIRQRIKYTQLGDDCILNDNEWTAKLCYSLAREAEERALME